MSLYYRQVELASGGKNGKDFELVDHSDGSPIEIVPLKTGFVIPTDAEIAAEASNAAVVDAELNTAKENVKNRPQAGGLPELEIRVNDLEAIIADLL